MVQIPAVDRVGVLVLADIGQIATQRLQLRVVELPEPAPDPPLERVPLSVQPSPVQDRRKQCQLHHRIRIVPASEARGLSPPLAKLRMSATVSSCAMALRRFSLKLVVQAEGRHLRPMLVRDSDNGGHRHFRRATFRRQRVGEASSTAACRVGISTR
jgi:hypothetical protein